MACQGLEAVTRFGTNWYKSVHKWLKGRAELTAWTHSAQRSWEMREVWKGERSCVETHPWRGWQETAGSPQADVSKHSISMYGGLITFIYFNSEIVVGEDNWGRKWRPLMSNNFEVMGTKSTASLSPSISLKARWDSVGNGAVTVLPEPWELLPDRRWRLQQLNKAAHDRARVRCPSPLAGTWPARHNWQRQMPSQPFLLSLSFELTLCLTWKHFGTPHVCHPAM